jgi:hypothetical protein
VEITSNAKYIKGRVIPILWMANLIKSNQTKPDVISYKEAVISGNFYEVFGDILVEKHLIPDDIYN